MDFPSLYENIVRRPEAGDRVAMTYWMRRLTSSTETKKVTVYGRRQNGDLRVGIYKGAEQTSKSAKKRVSSCPVLYKYEMGQLTSPLLAQGTHIQPITTRRGTTNVAICCCEVVGG